MASSTVLRPRIGRVVVVDEAHRPAVHDGRDLLPGEGFGLVLQMPHEDLDDFGERHLAAAQAGLLVDQGRAQDRLERAHQPAFGLADIGRDGLVAEQHPAFGLVVEEHRARHQRAACLRCGASAAALSRATPMAEFDVPKSSPQAIISVPFRREGDLIYYDAPRRCQSVSFRLFYARYRDVRGGGHPFFICALQRRHHFLGEQLERALRTPRTTDRRRRGGRGSS